MIKNYSYKTKYIAYYVVNYIKMNGKSSASGVELNFLTREKTSVIDTIGIEGR